MNTTFVFFVIEGFIFLESWWDSGTLKFSSEQTSCYESNYHSYKFSNETVVLRRRESETKIWFFETIW